jgi:hypothetical protein
MLNMRQERMYINAINNALHNMSANQRHMEITRDDHVPSPKSTPPDPNF